MPTVKVDVENLHFEHTLWRNELNFFEDELKIFEHRLEELVQKVENRNSLAELEHFQNQFIRQKDVLDDMKHEIKVHDQFLSDLLKKNLDPADRDLFQHSRVEEQMSTFRKLYAELKSDFFKFLIRNM